MVLGSIILTVHGSKEVDTKPKSCGLCFLELVALLVAGGAADLLPMSPTVSANILIVCPAPSIAFDSCAVVEMGAVSTASGWLEMLCFNL
jgi:hypothetical protein